MQTGCIISLNINIFHFLVERLVIVKELILRSRIPMPHAYYLYIPFNFYVAAYLSQF